MFKEYKEGNIDAITKLKDTANQEDIIYKVNEIIVLVQQHKHISDERYIFLYDILLKGDAKLSTDVMLTNDIVNKIKFDLRRYEFISSGWIIWWGIHLINHLLITFGL